MNRYKYEEWNMIEDKNYENFEEFCIGDRKFCLYVDNKNKPITGILEKFNYFSDNDPRNDVFVVNGKRKNDWIELLDFNLKYYGKESKEGHYHNPYDYTDKMIAILDNIYDYGSEEYIKYEDKIHDIGIEFWEM